MFLFTQTSSSSSSSYFISRIHNITGKVVIAGNAIYVFQALLKKYKNSIEDKEQQRTMQLRTKSLNKPIICVQYMYIYMYKYICTEYLYITITIMSSDLRSVVAYRENVVRSVCTNHNHTVN